MNGSTGDSKKTDRRVIKTKRAIKNALAELLDEKDVNDITVSEIARLADINRKTFYNYYDGIYSVIDEIQNEIADRFDSALGEIDFKNDMRDPYSIFEKLASVINMDMDFYIQVLRMRGSERLMDKIVEMLKAKTKQAFVEKVNFDSRKVDVMLSYAFSGLLAVYTEWLNNGRTQSIEEISEIVSVMCLGGFNGFVSELRG